MDEEEELLRKYNGPNQNTKREIIKLLYNNPHKEHQPETVFESIKDNCPANTSDTVANALSDLSGDEEIIEQERRSYYQWSGEGRRRPNRQLQEVRISMFEWLKSLELSFYTAILAFLIWALGMIFAAISLIPLFTSNSVAGITFIGWFRLAGTLTILGSTVVMIWIPLYLWDVRTAK
ncbi:hypothetical protein [Haloarchaeobius baliensis]|uniref:hypothetical protein n=1 Tax=Haloarchaeobius baliensis TaxID=1670458 RepID=UPI003F8840C8